MLLKTRTITLMGIIQVLLASTFVVWLLFFPHTGRNFAWPVEPSFTAMFIGAGFLVRVLIGYFLWRESYWPKLRWQVAANYAFLIVIFLATFWHIDEMNWGSNIFVAHIWVIAYTVEPIMLFLVEPRSAEAKAPLPPEEQGGIIFPGLKRLLAFGLVVCITLGSIAFINPQFLDTRWPWVLDPFDARIMAAFLALNALFCVTVYFAQDWGEIRLAVLGLTLYAVSNFIIWLVILPQLDPARKNIYTYGIVTGLFSVLLIYYYWKQERMTLRTPVVSEKVRL
jgi:hypothetical protein